MAEPVRARVLGRRDRRSAPLRPRSPSARRATRTSRSSCRWTADRRDGRASPSARRSRSLFPPDTLLVIPRGTHVEARAATAPGTRPQHHIDLARRRGEDAPDRDELFESPDVALRRARIVRHDRARRARTTRRSLFPFRAPEADRPRHQAAASASSRDGIPTIILCDNAGQAERLDELLTDDARPSPAALAIGVLDGGFIIPPRGAGFRGLRVLTDHEIFRRERRIRRARRYATGDGARDASLRSSPATTSSTSSTASGSIAASRRSSSARARSKSRSSSTRAATGSTSRSIASTRSSAIARPPTSPTTRRRRGCTRSAASAGRSSATRRARRSRR